jgi:methylthioribose-1-phosphate isomerase
MERRSGDEVAVVGGRRIVPADTTIENRAFDVTPAALVSALITEEGVYEAGDSPIVVTSGSIESRLRKS